MFASTGPLATGSRLIVCLKGLHCSHTKVRHHKFTPLITAHRMFQSVQNTLWMIKQTYTWCDMFIHSSSMYIYYYQLLSSSSLLFLWLWLQQSFLLPLLLLSLCCILFLLVMLEISRKLSLIYHSLSCILWWRELAISFHWNIIRPASGVQVTFRSGLSNLAMDLNLISR